MQFNFAHLYQQQELSDLDVLIVGPVQQHQDTDSSEPHQHGICRLASFPGHKAILSNSPFFKAQILRWQHKRPHQDVPGTPTQAGQAAAAADVQHRQHAAADSSAAPGNHQAQQEQHNNQQQQQDGQQRQQVQKPRTVASAASSNGSDCNSRRPQLVLTLDSADQQPAALAVLQALYGVKGLPELLSGLQQEQQLHVALLADMWQVPQLTSAAVYGLYCHLNTHGRLSEEATQQLLTLLAVPEFLQALLERMLICRFGDLEAVWGNPAQAEALLKVSLPVMCMFLSLGGLQVASEDTVLYTAQRYVDQFSDRAVDFFQKEHVKQQLAPLIRCQHLSLHWLATVVAAQDAGRCVLAPLRHVLPELLMLASGNKGSLSQN